ncbi:MAG: NADH-quinone oxidoreductase subunit NuoF [Candidatus Tectomicrobia bacterium]|nr:NADH-quinone oxidoreductase subunit NuoF [Candidatus Tectomicrobia bacterium]
MSELIITQHKDIPDTHKIDVYLGLGGYEGVKKALLEMKPEEIVNEVRSSNLRGLGGAGFPTGVKWGFLPKDTSKPKYLCVNGDEGEPGTFANRWVFEHDPHMLIEGCIITCYALGIHTGYIYIRGEYARPMEIVQGALNEAYERGFLGKNIFGTGFDLDLFVHPGAGCYIAGEETGLIDSIEGKKAWPRPKPPFPALIGLYNLPTLVNNVETLSHVPHIVKRGGAWFASLGTPREGGTRVFSISGHVKKPGLYELPMGTKLRDIIFEHAGGILGDKKLKAVVPGGLSAPILRADEIDIPATFEGLAAAGSMAGSGAIIVLHEETCIAKALQVTIKFYAHESCGQCTPCREGTAWMAKVMNRMMAGKGHRDDIENLLDTSRNMVGQTVCPLSEAAALPVQSYITKFRDEFEFHLREGRCHLDNTA